MKQRIIATLAALLFLIVGYAGNILVDDVALKPGETNGLRVSLGEGAGKMVGVQFSITLPDGFSLEEQDGDLYQLSSEQVSDMTCSVSERGGNTYQVIAYSNTLQSLNTGELMTLNLKAGSHTGQENYKVRISDVAFSDYDGVVTKENGVEATIKLTNFFPALTNLQVDDITAKAGETVLVGLSLQESINGCVGIQFDLSLPEGFSLAKDANELEYLLAEGQANDLDCNLLELEDGQYRFIMYSTTLQEFTNGKLMDLCLNVSKETPQGEYALTFQNVLLSDLSGNVYQDNGEKSIISIVEENGIRTIAADKNARIFTIGGIQRSKLKRGVNVIRYQNGTNRKVVVK